MYGVRVAGGGDIAGLKGSGRVVLEKEGHRRLPFGVDPKQLARKFAHR